VVVMLMFGDEVSYRYLRRRNVTNMPAVPEGAVLGGEVALEVFKFAKEHHLLDHLLDLFKKKHHILVLGSTGTGKTNLILSLTRDVEAISRMERTGQNKNYRRGIYGKPFVFIDTPGDQMQKEERKRAIRETLNKGIEGVINVVSYGYHEGRASVNAVIDAGRAKIEFLEAQRSEEISRLGEWTGILGDRGTISWCITVVNKADLWWNQEDEVLRYYREGRYHEALGNVSRVDEGVIEYCSVMHKFYDIAPLAGTFDDKDRRCTRTRLLEKIIVSTRG